MDRRERYVNPTETLKAALKWSQSRMWTCLPGIVVGYPGTAGYTMTVDVQPAINGMQRNTDETLTPIQMPVIMDCPLVFPSGGGVTLTTPVRASTITNGVSNDDGDECLIFFSARSIDNWFVNGGVQNPCELRMHNLSDGFVIVGPKSLPNTFDLDLANACLISDDQETFITLNPTTKAIVATAQGGVTINGVLFGKNGDISNIKSMAGTNNGTVSGFTDYLNNANTSLTNHTHTSESPGTPTSPPIAGT